VASGSRTLKQAAVSWRRRQSRAEPRPLHSDEDQYDSHGKSPSDPGPHGERSRETVFRFDLLASLAGNRLAVATIGSEPCGPFFQSERGRQEAIGPNVPKIPVNDLHRAAGSVNRYGPGGLGSARRAAGAPVGTSVAIAHETVNRRPPPPSPPVPPVHLSALLRP